MPFHPEIEGNTDALIIASSIVGGLERARGQAADPENTLVTITVDRGRHYPPGPDVRGVSTTDQPFYDQYDITLGFLALDTKPEYHGEEIGHGRPPLGHIAIESVSIPRTLKSGGSGSLDTTRIAIPIMDAENATVSLGTEEAVLAASNVMEINTDVKEPTRITHRRRVWAMQTSYNRAQAVERLIYEEVAAREAEGYKII